MGIFGRNIKEYFMCVLVSLPDLYKHAFDSARKAEEYKFRAKFDVLLTDLHRTLDTHSPKGLADNFASASCEYITYTDVAI
jgi:hypothetical protein